MHNFKIDLGDRRAFEPKEHITFEVSWQLANRPKAVELRVVWNTAGKGTQDVGLAEKQIFENPSTFDRRDVSLVLPSHPYSFSGKLVSIIWALELVAFPSRESTRVEITIAPGGQEVLAKGLTNAGA